MQGKNQASSSRLT
jgi:hypothetical protein